VGVDVQLHAFVSSAIDGGEPLALLPPPLLLEERASVNHWVKTGAGLAMISSRNNKTA